MYLNIYISKIFVKTHCHSFEKCVYINICRIYLLPLNTMSDISGNKTYYHQIIGYLMAPAVNRAQEIEHHL